jgi:acetyltransferase-like isoleucine patch superfamily enzyme
MMTRIDAEEYRAITAAWDYESLPANVQIGPGCYLERKDSFKRFRSVRDPGLVLGSGVRVHTWTEFNIEPEGQVRIGSDTVLVGAILMCACSVQIGRDVVISYNVTITDCDFHPIDPELRRLDAIANSPFGDRGLRPPLLTRPVVIEDEVWIGIGAVVLKGVQIGRGAQIGAGTVVTKNVPAGARVAGNPAREIAA